MKFSEISKNPDSNVFEDLGLTDSQGNPARFTYQSTAWGGHMLDFVPNHSPDIAVFSGDAYKRFLSWLVVK